jgi:hypothetical protein
MLHAKEIVPKKVLPDYPVALPEELDEAIHRIVEGLQVREKDLLFLELLVLVEDRRYPPHSIHLRASLSAS